MTQETEERPNPALHQLVRRLRDVPITAELAPGIWPGSIQFVENHFTAERDVLDRQYCSPTLLQSSHPADEILSFRREAEMYLASFGPTYLAVIENLLGQFSPNRTPTPTTVCIAVAAHEEGYQLYTTLENYANQNVAPDDFEITLFLNRPKLASDGQPTDDKLTMEALEAFQRNYSGSVHINALHAVLPFTPAVGQVKKMLHDAVIARHLEADSIDPILILNDSDMVRMPNDYVGGFTKYFRQSPIIDAVVGEFDLDHETYVNSPFIHVAQRLHMIISTLKGNSIKPITTGNNSAIRGASYCVVGGTPPIRRPVEDAYLGLTLTKMRGSEKSIIRPQADRSITAQVSARRVVAAWRQGYAPNEKWRLNFGAHNPTVRDTSGPPIARDHFTTVTEFDDTLEYILNLIANYESDGDDPQGWDSELYQKAFSLLGLTFSLENRDGAPYLRLGETSQLRQALDLFRYTYTQ